MLRSASGTVMEIGRTTANDHPRYLPTSGSEAVACAGYFFPGLPATQQRTSHENVR